MKQVEPSFLRFRKGGLLLALLLAAGSPIMRAREAENLPIRVEAEVGTKGGEPHLMIRLVNLTSGEVAVRRDLMRGAEWFTRILTEDEKRSNPHLFFWKDRRRCGGISQKWEEFIRKQLEIPGNAVAIKPGGAYVFAVSFEQVFAAAGVKDRKDLDMIAQLTLEDVILSSPGADDLEARRLYDKIFHVPSFIFRGGEWKPY